MKDTMIEIKISTRSSSSKLKTLGISIFSSIASRVIASIILKLIARFFNF
jgi:hypothetical protein